uniref:Uncharacterized protein n=1 Tax=Anguilla anguilla TaxID=7936 RepID=A0A0E9XYH7_ANGAN
MAMCWSSQTVWVTYNMVPYGSVEVSYSMAYL